MGREMIKVMVAGNYGIPHRLTESTGPRKLIVIEMIK